MNKIDAKKYKDYPEGSGGKRKYDLHYLPFQDYLNKYFVQPDLSRWHYVYSKFVMPIFDDTTWTEYKNTLNKIKPPFMPQEKLKIEFWQEIEHDHRFSIEFKHFFTFLYMIDFYKEMSFDEWLKSRNWMHPWYTKPDEEMMSISEILNYQHSEEYLKFHFAMLTIF